MVAAGKLSLGSISVFTVTLRLRANSLGLLVQVFFF